jgi:hypothetical protein
MFEIIFATILWAGPWLFLGLVCWGITSAITNVPESLGRGIAEGIARGIKEGNRK